LEPNKIQNELNIFLKAFLVTLHEGFMSIGLRGSGEKRGRPKSTRRGKVKENLKKVDLKECFQPYQMEEGYLGN